jgi:hypothetical protein
VSTPTPAFAPYVPTYASYTPYITPQEFLNAPTGVDTSQLVPSGSTLTQQAALLDLIGRASARADLICKKVLAATLDVQSGEYRIWRDGTIRVPVDYSPLVSVNAVSLGYAPGGMAPLADLSGIRVERKVARIPTSTLPSTAVFSSRPAAFARPGWVFADVGYVSGWAHTTLSVSAAQGDQQVTPVSVYGIVPGLPMTLKDGQDTEPVVVAAGYVPGSAVVPLAAPLLFAHAAGVTLSALPPVVKDAVIDLCKWLVKSKGSKAIVMGSIRGRAVTTQKTEPGGDDDYTSAEKALLALKRAR